MTDCQHCDGSCGANRAVFVSLVQTLTQLEFLTVVKDTGTSSYGARSFEALSKRHESLREELSRIAMIRTKYKGAVHGDSSGVTFKMIDKDYEDVSAKLVDCQLDISHNLSSRSDASKEGSVLVSAVINAISSILSEVSSSWMQHNSNDEVAFPRSLSDKTRERCNLFCQLFQETNVSNEHTAYLHGQVTTLSSAVQAKQQLLARLQEEHASLLSNVEARNHQRDKEKELLQLDRNETMLLHQQDVLAHANGRRLMRCMTKRRLNDEINTLSSQLENEVRVQEVVVDVLTSRLESTSNELLTKEKQHLEAKEAMESQSSKTRIAIAEETAKLIRREKLKVRIRQQLRCCMDRRRILSAEKEERLRKEFNAASLIKLAWKSYKHNKKCYLITKERT